MKLYKRPCRSSPGGLRNLLESMGVSVRETSPEMSIATVIVTANFVKHPTEHPGHKENRHKDRNKG
jgi:hypothetical protein